MAFYIEVLLLCDTDLEMNFHFSEENHIVTDMRQLPVDVNKITIVVTLSTLIKNSTVSVIMTCLE